MQPALIYIVLLAAVVAIVLGSMSLWRYLDYRRRPRRTPLSTGLLRPPGHSLSQQIKKLETALDQWVLFMVMTPVALTSAFFGQWALSENRPGVTFIALSAVVFGLFFVYLLYRVIQLMKRRRNMQLGYDCELAMAQELNALARKGYYVFHDVPADSFNIDHVTVGPTGVVAIETKGRPKPLGKDGQAIARMRFEQGRLQFPGWSERKPLDQATRQARWLAKWLSEATGEPVPVKPALIFPGWYVEQKAPSEVMLFNGRDPDKWIPQVGTGKSLTEAQIARIVHQLDQRCRDVDAQAYKKKSRAAAWN